MRGLRRLARCCAALVLAWSTGGSVAANPAIEHWTSEHGAAVYFVAAPEIPMLDVRLVFAAGSARDGVQPGVAALTNDLLTEGTATLAPDEFHSRLDATGAILGSGSLRDMAWLSLRTLTREPERATSVGLLGELLRAPRFEETSFARQRDQALAGLKRVLESPGSLGSRAFFRALYGDHPYGSPPEGTAESLAHLGLADLRDFHARHYVARNLTIAIVGALSRDEAEALAEALAASLPAGEPAPALPPLPTYVPATEHIEFTSAQSHVFVGQRGLAREDPDYFPLLVGNHVLGGNGVVSLLFDEVREKRGLSYSVESHFEPMALNGPFVASLQTSGRQLDEALAVLRETIAGYVEHGPDPAAFDAAKRNLVGGFPLRIDNNSKLVENLAVIGFYRLPLDYLASYTRKVDAVTLEQVAAAMRRRIDPARFVQVTVGQREAGQAAAR
jgi:zinc protease